MNLITSCMVLAYILSAHAGPVEERVGKIYPFKGAVLDKPLYIQTTKVETLSPGKIRSETVIKDDKGEVVMKEAALIEDGRIVEQTQDQLQVQERYKLTVSDGKAYFRTYTLEDGEEKLKEETSEPLKKNFVTGPATEAYLLSQADRLAKGEKVKANFGTFEAGRSVEYEFRPKTRSPAGDAIKVRMEPASIWLNFMADPIELEIDPATYRLTHYHGRTSLRMKSKSGAWKPLDADIQFTTTLKQP